jgi:TolB-like protein/DNA-binding winged helix-turn-helix (wHTH) protein/Tfp pilus assembly protein PilF
MADREPKIVRFGNFEVNQRTCELRKHGLRIKLQQKPFQVLNILLESPGEVVGRDEIQRSLWPDGVFVDFDHGLNTAIKKLRDALGDTAAASRFIETVDRRGYRFSAPVVEIAPIFDPTAQPNPPSPPAVEPNTPPISPIVAAVLPNHERLWIGVVIFFVVLAGASLWASFRSGTRKQTSRAKIMVAVLPFENLTGDAGQEYFSDGLTEEMIVQLGRLDSQHLGVIARTSVMHYQHSHEQLDQIGRELGVQYVLEGSVRRDSEKVRITAELIQLKDQTHLWSRQYDRELSSLLTLQGEIAQEVADEIELTLGTDRERAASIHKVIAPSSYEAYDLYLKGRYFWNKRTGEGFRQAAEYFQRAIAKDPQYARAYAGLADTYALLSSYHFVSQNEFMPKARAAAVRALEIDDTLAEAHTSLALIAENYDWDWQTAEKEYRRAIQLNPGYATAHHWYAECLAFEGRFDEALAESERAQQLDPLSLIIGTDNAAIFYYSRQYDRAIKGFLRVREMDPDFPKAGMVIEAYVEKGRFQDALATIHESSDGPWKWATEAYIYGRWGHEEEARRALAKLEQLNHRSQMEPQFRLAYLGLNRNDEVIASLRKDYLQHSNDLTILKVDPAYDPLRNDPRFRELLREVRLER